MQRKMVIFVGLLVIIGLVWNTISIHPVTGNAIDSPGFESPTQNPCLPGEICRDEDGNWFVSQAQQKFENLQDEPKTTSEPDDYGYTWDDSVPYAWVDVTGGTNTGLTEMDEQINISLPFDFPFYWNHYSNLYIVTPGYLTLYEQPVVGQSEIPNDNFPNGIIAPFWAPLMPEMNTGWIRYMTGGTEPNRYLVVEWYEMQDSHGNRFTFEVILYENGNILFQYQQIGEEYWCASTGIESETAYYGLAYPVWCDNYPAEGTAVLFTRPGPVARVNIDKMYLGKFGQPRSTTFYSFTVMNNGGLGIDTFDFDISSSLPATIFNYYGPAFSDTDLDGKIDTGPLRMGEEVTVELYFYIPRITQIGAEINTSVTLTSSLDTTISKTVFMETSIPAPFTQTFSGFDSPANILELNWANYQSAIKITRDYTHTKSPVVAETPDNKFINVWENYEWANYNESSFLQYALTDSFGKILKPFTDLTEKVDSEEYHYYDKDPAVSVTADGKIGVAWYSYAYNENADLHNYNIRYAILDSTGKLVFGPINLTNNTAWAHLNDEGFIKFGPPSIAATTDNRFMIAWDQSTVVNGEPLDDIYFSILQSNGASIIPPLKITGGLAGSVGYKNPLVTTIEGNRFFITYLKLQKDSTGWLKYFPYSIYASNGSNLKAETDTGLWGNLIDVVQLSGGNLLLASAMGGSSISKDVGYTILSNSDYSPIYISPGIEHPAAEVDEIFGLSITKDYENRGILTWTDDEGENLYYALIAADGTVIDGPSIFQSALDIEENSFSLSFNGSSSTTNSTNPTKYTDAVVSFNSDLYGVAPGEQVAITIHYGSQGFATAMAPYLTLTLSDGLTYISDTHSESPYIEGNEISWFAPYLEYGEGGEFIVYVTIPSDAQIGIMYPIDIEIITDEIGEREEYPENNIDHAQIMSSEQLFLPTLLR